MHDKIETVKQCSNVVYLLFLSTIGQFFNGPIDNVVIPLTESSVNVSCPITTMVTDELIEWFNATDPAIAVAMGVNYTITVTASYYCQVMEDRGVYRSNTFTVYRTGG